MFTVIFMACVLYTIAVTGAVIRMVLRDERNTREISRAGDDFLARWRV